MALKAMVKTLEGLDDAHKALYRQDGEHYVLDVEPVEGFVLENVTALKAALQKERETADEAVRRAKAFENLDPQKARDALAKVESMKTWTPEDKVTELIEQRTREIAAAKDEEIEKLKTSADTFRKGYEALTLDRALTEAAEKHKFLAPKVAAKLFRDSVRLEERDGQLVTAVVAPDGKPAQVVNNDGTMRLKTIEEFVAEQAKNPDYAPLIAGNNATGTRGATTPQTNTDTAPKDSAIVRAEAMNRLEQQAARQLGRASA